jgi:hypothetical protein
VYGEGKVTVEEVVGTLLAEHGQTVGVAEIGTGGQLSARWAACPSAAQVFRGAIHLAEAEQTEPIEALAQLARTRAAATWGLALHINLQAETNPIQLAVTNGVIAETRAIGYGGPPALIPVWASTMAINLLRATVLKG